MEVFDALEAELPDSFTVNNLRITRNWEAYALFVKGKRATSIAENKLGYYEQAIKKDPTFFLALYNTAMLYKTQTDYSTARTRLMKAAAATEDPALLADVYFDARVDVDLSRRPQDSAKFLGAGHRVRRR